MASDWAGGVLSRYFTPEEANAALQEVRPIVERMVRARRELVTRQKRQAELAGKVAGNGHGQDAREYVELTAELDRAAAELVRCLEEIEEIGAQVKDLDVGLVDFPAVHEGREVLLCWQLGEDEIAFWHGLDDGFAGRRPLPF